jgi:hypothetical protein
MVDNPVRDAEIIRRRKAGGSFGVIAARMKISRSTVAGVINRAGLCEPTKRPRKYNAGFRSAVIASAMKTSQSAAARAWGVSQPTVSTWCRGVSK